MVLAALALSGVAGIASAADAPQGSISGQIVNKTPGGPQVGDLEVALIGIQSSVPLSSPMTTKADADGKFQFSGLTVDPGIVYVAQVGYLDVYYTSDDTQLTAESASQTIELAVYETTESDAAIKVANAHMVLDFLPGQVDVLEVWRFANSGDRTYVGTKSGESRNTLRFSLPAGASGVDHGEGMAPEPTSNGIVDTLPVIPGVRDIAFAYSIPYQSSKLTITKKADYAIDSFGLLAKGDGGVAVSSVALTKGDPLNMGGVTYLSYSAKGVAAGADLDASLSGLPVSTTDGKGSSMPSIPLIWVGAGVVGLALVVGIAYPIIRRRRAAVAVGSGFGAEDERQALLMRIAKLDDEFEAGTLGEQEYQSRRSELKRRVAALPKDKEAAA